MTRMHCVVTNYAHSVEGLLNAHIEPVCHEATNVIVDILSGLTQLFAQFLDGQSNERRGSSGVTDQG